MQTIFIILMFILGAALGSFLCCTARRLRRREQHRSTLGPRSVCLSCKRQLKWYENLPIISWLIQGGRCRHCHKRIGIAEFLAELGTATALTALATTISVSTAATLDWVVFLVACLLTLLLCFLAIYDGLYGELPSPLLTISIFCAIVIVALRQWASLSVAAFSWGIILSAFGGALVLGGIYLALYLASKGKWVGNGDWLLGTAIGLALGSPWLALVALFIANFSACLIMYPLVHHRSNKRIYFGPFLVLAFIATYTLAEPLTSLIAW